jgi:phytoene desaturase
VVVGAGLGGLAAAVRLGARGWRVTVLDRLDGPGGRAYTFRQDGYVFDAGPTILTAPHLFEELWALAGRRFADDVALRPLDPYYRIRFDDGDVFEPGGDPDRLRAQIERIEPGAWDGYRRFLDLSELIFEAAFTRLVDVPFHRLSTVVRAAPDLIRLGGYRSVHAKVRQYFRSEKLRIAFGFHPLFVGGNPLTATAYYCLIAHLERMWGVHYAIGGTGAIVRGIEALVLGQGNQVRYGAQVDEILVRDGQACGVALTDGTRIDADIVVSNAEIVHTYGHLLRRAPRRGWTDRRLSRVDHSMSLFVWYFGTRRRFDDVHHHTIVLGPRYEGLLRDIFGHRRRPDDPSLYLHRPTASDPSLAPGGCDAFYVLAPVPHLDDGTDWTAIAEPFRRAVAQRLSQTVLPGFEEHIVTSRVMTPLDFRDRLLSTKGAAFGLEPRLLQSAWFRPHNLSGDVAGLFLVGAGTHPGAGVPGVISSAKVVDRLVPDAAAWAQGARP